jgi:hypothetical protein
LEQIKTKPVNQTATNQFDLLFVAKFNNPNSETKASRANIDTPHQISVSEQGCQIFFVHDTQTGKNVPNEHKMYQMNTKCTKIVIKFPKCL